MPIRRRNFLGGHDLEGMNPNYMFNVGIEPPDLSVGQDYDETTAAFDPMTDPMYNPPPVSTKAQEELMKYGETQPTWEKYKPHWLTRVAGGLGGFSAGAGQGAGAGVEVGRDIL